MAETVAATAALERFFHAAFPAAVSVEVRDYATIQGGLSRQTARFTVVIDGMARSFVARSDPAGASLTAQTDRDAEWLLLEALTRRGGVPMPDACHCDVDGSQLGAKTIIIDFIDGDTVTAASRGLDGPGLDELAMQLARLLAKIHRVTPDELPPAMAPPLDWDRYIDSHLARARRIEGAHCEPDPVLRYMIEWLHANRPRAAPFALVHGELQSSNIMRDTRGALWAVDWEFAHIGDPREDLGWCKMVEALHEPVLIRRDEDRFLAEYRARTGMGADLVNPRSLDYFLVLASIAVLGTLYEGIDGFARGERSDYRTAFVTGALLTAHREWVRVASRYG